MWRAHQMAWPRPSGACWRVKLIVPGLRQLAAQRLQLLGLAARLERRLELIGEIEMILDARLVAAGDEDEVLDSRLARLVEHIFERRAVDDGQHFLRYGLGGGQETGAEAGDGNDGFAETDLPQVDLSIAHPFQSLTLKIVAGRKRP